MTIARISVLALTLLLLVAVACSSEDAAGPSPAEPKAASTQPTAAPDPASPAVASAAPTQTPSPTATAEPEEQELKIVTLLPFDSIPAVLAPEFISAEEADAKLADLLEQRTRGNSDEALPIVGNDPDDALVLGLSINGDSRAYYVPSLSAVEIVNDTVGGQPLAVTW